MQIIIALKDSLKKEGWGEKLCKRKKAEKQTDSPVCGFEMCGNSMTLLTCLKGLLGQVLGRARKCGQVL